MTVLLVRRHLDADRLHEWHHGREPLLSQLVVCQPFQPVVELRAVLLEVVGKPKPLDSQRKHPVDRALQLVFGGAPGLADPLRPVAAVAEMEVLLRHDFHQPTFPGAIRALLVDVTQEAESGLIVHRVGDDQLGPALQWHVERIRIAEGLRIPLEDQGLLAFPQLFEDVEGDMGMG